MVGLWQTGFATEHVGIGAEKAGTITPWHEPATGVTKVDIGAGLTVTTGLERHIAGASVPAGVLEDASPRTTVPLHGLVLKIMDGDST